MSNRRQQRRAKQVRRTNVRASHRAKRPPTPAEIAARVVRDYRELLESRDPLDAEVVASHLMSTGWDQVLDAPSEAADDVPHPALAVVALLRNVDPDPGELGPATLALAHALVAADLHDPQLAAAGGVLVEQLRAAGVADPEWAGEVGSYEFVRGVDIRDPWMDQHQLLLTFRDSADREHGIVALIDRLEDFQFAELDVIEDPAGMLADVRDAIINREEFAGMVVDEVSAARAGGMLRDAVGGTFEARGEALRDAEGERGGLALLQLVLQREELLAQAVIDDPDGAEATPFDSELDGMTADQLTERFAASPELAAEPDATPEAAELLMGWVHDCASPRALFGPSQVEELLIDDAPRFTDDGDARIALAEPLLAAARAWARHAGALAKLEQPVVDDAHAAIEHYAPHHHQVMAAAPGSMLASGRGGSMGGAIEQLTAQMTDEGVDTDDMDAVRAWMESNRPSIEG